MAGRLVFLAVNFDATEEFPSLHVLVERQYLIAHYLEESPLDNLQLPDISVSIQKYRGSLLSTIRGLTLITSSCLGRIDPSSRWPLCSGGTGRPSPLLEALAALVLGWVGQGVRVGDGRWRLHRLCRRRLPFRERGWECGVD